MDYGQNDGQNDDGSWQYGRIGNLLLTMGVFSFFGMVIGIIMMFVYVLLFEPSNYAIEDEVFISYVTRGWIVGMISLLVLKVYYRKH